MEELKPETKLDESKQDSPKEEIEENQENSIKNNPETNSTEKSIEPEPQEELNIEPLKKQKVEDNIKEFQESNKDRKVIFIAVAAIIIIFAAVMGGFKIFGDSTSTSGQVTPIEELHKLNLDGELSDDRGQMYDGFSFVKYDGLWWTDLIILGKKVRIPLHYSPSEVEHIEITGNLSDEFNVGQEIFIAINPEIINKHYTLALSELSFNTAKGINRIPVGSCTKEDPACIDREIISCADPKGKPVVELALGKEPRLELIDSCIKVTGQDEDLVKATDRLLYYWYTIMK
jgi:hypothetical protein